MTDRNKYRPREQYQSDRSQFSDDSDQGYEQMGDDYRQARYNDRYDNTDYRDEGTAASRRKGRGGSDRASGYDSQNAGDFGGRQYQNRERADFSSFNSEDFCTAGSVGPREHLGYGQGEMPRSGAYSSGSYGPGTYGVAPRRDYGGRDDDERGFFERAGDEVASWFGDEEASRRREQDHRGRGPANYTRSDDRILEDTCDKLTEDRGVDARNIQVTVQNGEVTLDGTVADRGQKRRAEDIVHELSGVGHVQNNLRTSDKARRETSDEENAAIERDAGTRA